MAILQKKQYEALTVETAVDLAKEFKLFSEQAELSCREIGDGNLNYVFWLKDEITGKSIIIKQALPYAKVVGESWPLTLKRSTIETNALRKHGEFVPQLVPEVYGSDESLAITIMEDLSHLTIARECFINGEDYPKLSHDIGEYLARTLFSTSDFALHPFEKKALVAQFSNPELCKITEDLIFTDPFFNHETNDYEQELQKNVEAIWSNKRLKLETAKLKKSFLTEAEALLHGDLHTGSIFASETETKVIDPEFAFYGPIGFDVGLFLGNLFLQSLSREEFHRPAIFDHINTTWNVFHSLFSELWEESKHEVYAEVEGYREYFLQKVFADTLGFAGCELIRRTIGLAHVKDLDGIVDNDRRIQAKKNALALGEELILRRNVLKTIQEAISLIGEITK